jgi:hypothetical protein
MAICRRNGPTNGPAADSMIIVGFRTARLTPDPHRRNLFTIRRSPTRAATHSHIDRRSLRTLFLLSWCEEIR